MQMNSGNYSCTTSSSYFIEFGWKSAILIQIKENLRNCASKVL